MQRLHITKKMCSKFHSGKNDSLITNDQISDVYCGESSVPARNSSNRIVGGYESAPNSFPWIISIFLMKENRHWCGGSLVPVGTNKTHSDIIITAAHCAFE